MPDRPKAAPPPEEPSSSDAAESRMPKRSRYIIWIGGLALGLYWIITGLWGVFTQGS